jgi:hypothetical protein
MSLNLCFCRYLTTHKYLSCNTGTTIAFRFAG